MAEAHLPTDVRCYRLVGMVHAEPPALAVFDIDEREHAAVHGLPREFDGLLTRGSPARRAGREQVQEPRAPDRPGLRHLGDQSAGNATDAVAP